MIENKEQEVVDIQMVLQEMFLPDWLRIHDISDTDQWLFFAKTVV